jgi:hypothetical protein
MRRGTETSRKQVQIPGVGPTRPRLRLPQLALQSASLAKDGDYLHILLKRLRFDQKLCENNFHFFDACISKLFAGAARSVLAPGKRDGGKTMFSNLSKHSTVDLE